jgi:hypothetical protein
MLAKLLFDLRISDKLFSPDLQDGRLAQPPRLQPLSGAPPPLPLGGKAPSKFVIWAGVEFLEG